LDLSITRYHKGHILLFEQKKYYHIRRRLYNNIICINKLKDGLIRKYQVFNEFELKALEKYLTNKNILFRICEETISYKKKYKMLDESYKYYLHYRDDYPEDKKIFKHVKIYIEVYKGYVNLAEIKDRYYNINEYKYGIYL
jgi:hypothetical protein